MDDRSGAGIGRRNLRKLRMSVKTRSVAPVAVEVDTVDEALKGADAAIVQAEWAEYRELPPEKFVELMRPYGEVVDMRFQRAAYQEHDILSVLTDKQREILITAFKHGYYDYPRRINSEKLSHKVDISKATLLEHMRKAEGRLLSNILAGY